MENSWSGSSADGMRLAARDSAEFVVQDACLCSTLSMFHRVIGHCVCSTLSMFHRVIGHCVCSTLSLFHHVFNALALSTVYNPNPNPSPSCLILTRVHRVHS